MVSVILFFFFCILILVWYFFLVFCYIFVFLDNFSECTVKFTEHSVVGQYVFLEAKRLILSLGSTHSSTNSVCTLKIPALHFKEALHTVLHCTLYCTANCTTLLFVLQCTPYCTEHYYSEHCTTLHTVRHFTLNCT